MSFQTDSNCQFSIKSEWQVSSILQDSSQYLNLSSAFWYYLPTPPLGQDMTQGQFLSGV